MEGAAEEKTFRNRPAEAVARLLQTGGVKRFGIAVSGGSDSMALLVAVREILDRIDGYHAVCLHVDHGLREDSASDRQFVRSRAAAHAFPFEARCVVPKKRTANSSFEAAAREARYAALVEAARSLELEAILLAHHEDDRVETTALNLLRGSGVRGLKGLIAERRFESSPDVKFLRPFLSFKKAELLDYLTARGETFVVDATNDDTTLKRNRLRKHCLASETAETRRMRERLLAMADTAEELDRRAEATAAEWIERHVAFAAQSATIAMSDLLRLPALFGHVVVRAVVERLRGERYVVKDRRFADFSRWLTIPKSPLPGDWGDGVRVRRFGPRVVFECGTAERCDGVHAAD